MGHYTGVRCCIRWNVNAPKMNNLILSITLFFLFLFLFVAVVVVVVVALLLVLSLAIWKREEMAAPTPISLSML